MNDGHMEIVPDAAGISTAAGVRVGRFGVTIEEVLLGIARRHAMPGRRGGEPTAGFIVLI
jgi:hypothetical protein